MRSQKHINGTIAFLVVAIPICIAATHQESNLDKYVRFTGNLPNGLVEVAALNLPEQFVTRVASRSLRSAFRRQFRKVPNIANPLTQPAAQNLSQLSSNDNVRLLNGQISEQEISRWRKYAIDVPPLRGFRAPIAQQKNNTWTFMPPTDDNSRQYELAATYAAGTLAQMGLIRTTMNIMQQIDLPWLLNDKLDQTKLQTVGIPVDLLDCFYINDQSVNVVVAKWFQSGASKQAIEQFASQATFRFLKSHEGFKVAVDDGSESVGAIRMQLPIAGYQSGPTDGSTLDVLRQLFELDADEQLWTTVHKRNLNAVSNEIKKWGTDKRKTVTLVSVPVPFSRWAQDNAKPGTAPKSPDTKDLELITLLPRFANRNEQMSKFLPGDSLLFDVMEEVVGRCVSSPLLFQGGNLLVYEDPATEKRIMLLGEAEIYRNIALGLTPQQVMDAFKVEFSVDQVVKIPAITFHIDMEFTIRRVGDKIVACIADELRASIIIIDEAIKALSSANLITPEQLKRLQTLSKDDDLVELAKALRQLTISLRNGSFSLSNKAACALVQSPLESPQVNGQRFLLAVDLLTANAMQNDKFVDTTISRSEREYLQTLATRSAQRKELVDQLSDLALQIHRVPAFGDEEVGINYLNAVHLHNTVIFPALGGFFEPLDKAAAEEFQKAFGNDTKVQPIATAAAQQAHGGIHCMVSLYPAKGLYKSKSHR